MAKQTQQTILQNYFGYSHFRDGQAEIVETLLDKRDVLAIMPTGAGKSICYQVPAMLYDGITLVISPLISLMKDQVAALTQVGIAAAFLNSSLSSEEQWETIDRAKNGEFKLLYVAPEQLMTQRFLNFANTVTISAISVDEAHCVSQWGHDFRPGYLKVHEFIDQLETRPVIGAFTATATQQVKDDITSLLKLSNPFSITTGFDRENLSFAVKKVTDPFPEVQKYLETHPDKSGIIYCSTRKNVEEVCERLCNLGYSATQYHAGLSQEERMQNQEDFVIDDIPIMVATNAFGMGIDKSNVSFVIHYNMPKNMESYYQEAGRSGRDGSPADCLLLYSGKDVRTNQFFIDNAQENEELSPEAFLAFKDFEQERLKQITFYCYTQDCLRQYILRYFGETSPTYCGNCSNCLNNFEKKNITVEAQKILSCVKRMGQNFGVKMVVDVLRGSKNSRLLSLRLDEIATYNMLSDYSENQVRHMIQCLLVEGYLVSSSGQYPVLQLAPLSKKLLFEGATLAINLPKPEEVIKKPTRTATDIENPELFSRLQKLRHHFAQVQHVPAYLIFSNATLNEMCKYLPQTLAEMAQINGVGKIKLEQYGQAFLEVVSEYQKLKS